MYNLYRSYNLIFNIIIKSIYSKLINNKQQIMKLNSRKLHIKW